VTAAAGPWRGDVVLVQFPSTDLSGQKIRPAVIVARVVGPDLTVVFITSQVVGGYTAAHVLLDDSVAEFGATGLHITSTIRADRLVTLHRSLFLRRLGRLGPLATARLDQALREVFVL
jgi:mRNA interferase MazF